MCLYRDHTPALSTMTHVHLQESLCCFVKGWQLNDGARERVVKEYTGREAWSRDVYLEKLTGRDGLCNYTCCFSHFILLFPHVARPCYTPDFVKKPRASARKCMGDPHPDRVCVTLGRVCH